MNTKVEQWKAYAKIIKWEFIEGKITFHSSEKEYIKHEDRIKESLKHYVLNINNYNSKIPIIITIFAYDLYRSLTENFIATFDTFSKKVTKHIEDYVTFQYSDFPDSMVDNFTHEKIQMKLEHYVERISKSARGIEDSIVDTIKIAHFSCYLFCLINTGNAQNMPMATSSPSPNTKQPKPIKNDNPAVWDLVLKDIKERDKFGFKKYGKRLQPFNGRNVLFDLYQELLDAVVYIRQAIYERDKK